MKTIVLNPAAARQFDKLTGTVRDLLADALNAYAMGKPCDTKAMTGTPTVRMRVGDYRIIFDETPTTITVLALGHRREIYR
jgi:mRNA interferase RelE/StbE